MTTKNRNSYKCPVCGHNLDSEIWVTGDKDPQPGDISICYYCASANEFTENLNLKNITVHDFKLLDDATKSTILSILREILSKPL